MSIQELTSLIRELRSPSQYTTVSPSAAGAFPTVPQPGLFLIKPQYNTGTPLQHENIMWWQGPAGTGYTLAQLQAIQTAFDTQFQTVFAAYAGTGNKYLGCYVQDFSSSTGLSVAQTGGPFSSASNGNPSPDQVAILISWKTVQRYKGGHGRWYLPGVGTSVMQGADSINAATQSAIQGHIQSLQNAMAAVPGSSAGPLNFVIYRHRNGRTGTPQTVVPTGFVVNALVATQRRRLRKAAHR